MRHNRNSWDLGAVLGYIQELNPRLVSILQMNECHSTSISSLVKDDEESISSLVKDDEENILPKAI